MKVIFLVSGLLSGGLGFVIFFSSRATQQVEGLMLFLIGTVFLSVVVMMDTISGAQGETNELLRELLEASRQSRRSAQPKAKEQAPAPPAEPTTAVQPAAQPEAQPESQSETQVA